MLSKTIYGFQKHNYSRHTAPQSLTRVCQKPLLPCCRTKNRADYYPRAPIPLTMMTYLLIQPSQDTTDKSICALYLKLFYIFIVIFFQYGRMVLKGWCIMIKRFSVKNFKNFRNRLTLDFSCVRDYAFNTQLIKSGLVNKMLIYGPNNSGKSNLGAAIMDITNHLTDNYGMVNPIYSYYINGNSVDDLVEFEYVFLLNNMEIKYSYAKDRFMKLQKESLYSNDELLFEFNYRTNRYENNIKESRTLVLDKRNTEMSTLKYMYANTQYWPEDNPVRLLMEFVNNMLWFRSLRGNEFMGVMPNGENLNDFVINNRKIADFEAFLKKCGQNYKLCEINEGGKQILGVNYKNYKASFNNVASTGTLTLWLFYYWMNRTDNISFLYLDEFDAFYHVELSKYILSYVNSKPEFQSILTSHNTYLIDNELMRPDCYSLLKNEEIMSFADRTNRVIRQGNNLEKLMLGGEFEK